MSDPTINLSLTLEDMTLLLMNYRQGIKHLLGEREFIKLADDPACTTMLEIIDQKYTASMAQYEQFETLLKACAASVNPADVAEDWGESEPANPVVTAPIPELGAKVQYIGDTDRHGGRYLRQGRLYTVIAIVDDTIAVNTEADFVAGADVVQVKHDFYPLSDFTTEPTMQVGYQVHYTGHDRSVGDERTFKIEQLQTWGGVPYIGIATKTSHLSYPASEFRLHEHGVD